jgi:protease I
METPMPKCVLILATNGFEQSELLDPRKALEEAGFETVLASPEPGEIKGWKDKDWGESVKVDRPISDISADDFDALLLPGGQMNPDILRMDQDAIRLVKEMVGAKKPVAAICHGPWLLAEADVIQGKTVTSWPSIRTDLRNAGASVVDQEVTIDDNIITSRNPDDIPAFSSALIAALEDQVERV